jgi:hypothetical protein
MMFANFLAMAGNLIQSSRMSETFITILVLGSVIGAAALFIWANRP